MEDELFQLSNGRYVTSVEISEKLTYIKEHHPETSYQEDSTGYSWDGREWLTSSQSVTIMIPGTVRKQSHGTPMTAASGRRM